MNSMTDTKHLEQERVTFAISPEQYQHWTLKVKGDTAHMVLNIAEEGGIRPGYKLKLNSYDLGVDIELADALNRIRFEHPQVKLVILESAKERIWCSGANIYMLGLSTHAWKVNFCKFTNETRNGMEDSSQYEGLKFLAAVTGACAGGGYELALACDRIVMVDDRSSTVSLPEVPLLGVLPGTGGLTRVMDKRKVRRDLADIFCTTSEGVRADRATEWKLIDAHAKPQQFAELVEKEGAQLKSQSKRDATGSGVSWSALSVKYEEQGYSYETLSVAFDRERRLATFTLRAPSASAPTEGAAQAAQGANFWPLKFARELDDAILMLRTNELELGTWVFTTEGSAGAVIEADMALAGAQGHWFAREVLGFMRRTLARLDVSSRSLIALIDKGSCFAGTFADIALACDRTYMLDLPDTPDEAPRFVLGPMSFGAFPMVNGLTRIASRFACDDAAIAACKAAEGKVLTPAQALALGLVTATPDDIDWEDEIRLMLEERASLSPDALTGMEASLRFAGPETMLTRVFGRLTVWQNWIFIRPNAVGEEGALKLFGTGKKAKFDWKRV
jgi:benzoyl-CoA-dihydrodiol lyase